MAPKIVKALRAVKALPTLFLLIIVVLLGGALFIVLSDRERTFLVEASSSSVDLRFVGPRNIWYFPEVLVCTPTPPAEVPTEAPAAPDDAEPLAVPCDAMVFEADQRTEVSLAWPAGAGARITMDSDGTVVIDPGLQGLGGRDIGTGPGVILPAGVPEGAILVLPAETWRAQPALTFEAYAAIGREISAGARHYLHQGRWEARQNTSSLARFRASEVVKEGDLSSGAEVSIQYADGRPVVMFGHLTPDRDPEVTRGFDVTAISALGATELRLVHFGFSEAAIMRPDAIDTLASSSVLVAAVVIVTLLAALTQAGSDLILRWFEGPREDEKLSNSGRSEDDLPETKESGSADDTPSV
jgi:hypothetical protein